MVKVDVARARLAALVAALYGSSCCLGFQPAQFVGHHRGLTAPLNLKGLDAKCTSRYGYGAVLCGPLRENSGTPQAPAPLMRATSFRPPRIARLLSKVLKRAIAKRARQVSNLEAVCLSEKNRRLLKGHIEKICVTFDKLVFDKFQISGGGMLELTDLRIGLGALLSSGRDLIQRPFDAVVRLTLTPEDITSSEFIRTKFEAYVNKAGAAKAGAWPALAWAGATVRRVSLEGGRLVVLGEAAVAGALGLGDRVPFRYSCGLVPGADGHTLFPAAPALHLGVAGGALPLRVPVAAVKHGRPRGFDLGDAATVRRCELGPAGATLELGLLHIDPAASAAARRKRKPARPRRREGAAAAEEGEGARGGAGGRPVAGKPRRPGAPTARASTGVDLGALLAEFLGGLRLKHRGARRPRAAKPLPTAAA